jgi:hypothetical protein
MRYRAQSHVAARLAGTELVLMDTVSQDVYVANATAAELWTALASGADMGELGQAFAERVGQPQAAADVAAFVQELVDRGFIVPA